MCFFGGGGTRVVEKPMAVQTPAPVATKAALGEEEGVRLAQKERKQKEQSALQGMKIALNVGASGGTTPGGKVNP
jgi:hypothetical protein